MGGHGRLGPCVSTNERMRSLWKNAMNRGRGRRNDWDEGMEMEKRETETEGGKEGRKEGM